MHTELKEKGNMLYGGAIIENGKMIGSNIIAKFESREEFDDWLKNDPYTIGDVWQTVQVYEFKSAPGY